jgi:hypothetical protein
VNSDIHPSSFRDPSGFVFRAADGHLCRQINRRYENTYRAVMGSGLFADLTGAGLMVEHAEMDLSLKATGDAAVVIRPREVAFVSYPYEWSFSQLRDAALLTLRIQERAFQYGFCLKDCSAYNITFEGPTPVFIDTLSFDPYVEGRPWVAYRQFCQHFLAPLALMAYRHPELNSLLRVYLDGIPLTLASRLLPWSSWRKFGLVTHIHLHALFQQKDAARQRRGKSAKIDGKRVSKAGLCGLVDNLKGSIGRLSCPKTETEWRDYYANNSYTDESTESKKRIVAALIEKLTPKTVWDIGANTGLYSRIASRKGAYTMAFDVDWQCVEMNYQACKEEGLAGLLPLRMDLTNPSPGIGWAHHERLSLADRGPADVVMALALIHHISIGNNVPFARVAEYFAQLCRALIIEFVPKEDPQAQRLLESREDIFADYTRARFEADFSQFFRISEVTPVLGTGRSIYLMEHAS